MVLDKSILPRYNNHVNTIRLGYYTKEYTMQYEVYAYNNRLQTIRVIVATPALANRKAESLKNRLNKKFPYLTATAVIEPKPIITPSFADYDDELLA